MLHCVKCGKPMSMPQFECSRCRGDFCRECAAELQKCKACSSVLSKFRMPDSGMTKELVPGSGS